MKLHRIDDLVENYRRFVERAAAQQSVWVLVRASGKGACVSSQYLADAAGAPMPVELIFSDPAFAQRLIRDEHRDSEIRKLPLGRYLEILTHFGGRLVMPDPTDDLAAVELRPGELGEALRAATAGKAPDLRHVDRPMSLLDGSAFEHDDPTLVQALRQATPHRRFWPKHAQAVADCLYVLDLDHQVREDGFAQYLFAAGPVSIYAWMAVNAVGAHNAGALFDSVFAQLGRATGLDFDLRRALEARKSTDPILNAWLELITSVRRAHANRADGLAAFRHRFCGELPQLDAAWRRDVDVTKPVARYMHAHQPAFVV